jgi:Family of unknown function (DUF6496)
MSAPGINEIASTTQRNRTMPIGPTRTKAQKQNVVHQEMHEFKHGNLHSGSKTGPKVKSRKQAVAIALKTAGLSNKGAHQPHPATNPGDYDNEAHPGADYKRKGEEFKPGANRSMDAAPRDQEHRDVDRGVGMQPVQNMATRPPPMNAHGFGHGEAQRRGALRLSGNPGAHRIGAK